MGTAIDPHSARPTRGSPRCPGRSSIYRTLVRHHLLEPTQRKRARSDYKRWERSRSMELWQMDVVGRFHLLDGTEVKVVTGVDDHSRFCVCARVVARATARPVCEALQWALRTHGVPDQILTDNGKVFTDRFGQGPGPVLFDRICANNGIRTSAHGSVFADHDGQGRALPHAPCRGDFLVDHDWVHATIEELQSALDEWVAEYNTERPHQSLGDRPPARALRSSGCAPSGRSRDARDPRRGPALRAAARCQPLGRPTRLDRSRQVPLSGRGHLSLANPSKWSCGPASSRSSHLGILVATHAERRGAEH